jgi:hypothetical protein
MGKNRYNIDPQHFSVLHVEEIFETSMECFLKNSSESYLLTKK